jgi:stage V sporulation protein SpoVS
MASSSTTPISICPICQDSITDEQIVRNPHEGEKVSHVFHKTCLDLWFATGQRTCPLCNVIVLDRELMRTEEGRSELLAQALRHQNRREIELILTAGSVNQLVRTQALASLIENDNLDLFDRFFDGKESFSINQIYALSELAINHDKREFLNNILAKSILNPTERGRLLFHAIFKENLPVEILDIFLRDGPIDVSLLSFVIERVVQVNRPDLLIKLLPLGDVFFLGRLKGRARELRHHEVLALLEDPRLARPASMEAHFTHLPTDSFIYCMRALLPVVLLLIIYNSISELIRMGIPQG